ncbi:hypothetical protein [Mycetocola zhujimingii]|uniref:Uncharacterized protein n=1 Tax=Mycetocola zhujimingii TaxID=2079792 RepID=A0A2U1TCF1_9MICO|nr:hypothetical protein [Mycetocola zhujimingii]PWC06565.1 hypothetical protein DF223_10710 [Mycetocola zhujimingii]
MSKMTANSQAQRWFEETFGTSIRAHQIETQTQFPKSLIKEAELVVTNAGVADLIAKWQDEDGKSKTGRKEMISIRALLTLMLMHVREGKGVLFSEISNTLANRLDDQGRLSLGITQHEGRQEDWYDRLARAVRRLMKLVDPLPGARRKIPTAGEYAKILANRDPVESARKQKRLDLLCNQLVEGSVLVLPRDVRRKFRGNVALDATFFAMHGKLGNPRRHKEDHKDRNSINYDAGWYTRDGDHDGERSLKNGSNRWGLELEIATMTANKPGVKADFPLLAIGVGAHLPGHIKLAGKRMFESIVARGYERGYVTADLAYLPNSKEDELQGPLLAMGYTPVFDYKKGQFGKQAHYDHAIQVDGQWYVEHIPKELVNAVETYLAAPGKTREEKAAAKLLLEQRRTAREVYRLKPKGVRRPDGSQQYMYPGAGSYVAFDEVTGELLPSLTKRTVVIPLYVGLKFGQKFAHRGKPWIEHYGLRSTVEAFNSFVKDTEHEDMGNPAKRRARGNTFAYVATTLAVVSANLRKIFRFFQDLMSEAPKHSKNKHERFKPVDTHNVVSPAAATAVGGAVPAPPTRI